MVDVYHRYVTPSPKLFGTAHVFRDANGALIHTCRDTDIRSIQEGHVVLLITNFKPLPGMEAEFYPYVMPEHPHRVVPKTLGDMEPTEYCAWEVEMVVKQRTSGVPGLYVPPELHMPGERPQTAKQSTWKKAPRTRARTPSSRRGAGKNETGATAVG